MNDFLQKVFLQNTVRSYLIVAGTILLILIIKRLLSKYFAGLLYRIFDRKNKKAYRRSFMQLVVEPLGTFLFVVITVIAFDKLNFPDALNFPLHKITTHDAVEALVNAILVITFIRLCIRIIKFIAFVFADKTKQTNQSGSQFIIFFNDFFSVLLIILGILLVLHFSFDYKIGNALTGLSILGAAIALATRESLENLIASFIIFFDKPFVTGDVVKVQNLTGTVEKIGLRSTRIRTDEKTYITVPNKQMVDSILDNLSMRSQKRTRLKLEIDQSATAEQLQNFVNEINLALQKYEVENVLAYINDISKNAIVAHIDYFTTMLQPLQDYYKLQQAINLHILNILHNNNIALVRPFVNE